MSLHPSSMIRGVFPSPLLPPTRAVKTTTTSYKHMKSDWTTFIFQKLNYMNFNSFSFVMAMFSILQKWHCFLTSLFASIIVWIKTWCSFQFRCIHLTNSKSNKTAWNPLNQIQHNLVYSLYSHLRATDLFIPVLFLFYFYYTVGPHLWCSFK